MTPSATVPLPTLLFLELFGGIAPGYPKRNCSVRAGLGPFLNSHPGTGADARCGCEVRMRGAEPAEWWCRGVNAGLGLLLADRERAAGRKHNACCQTLA